MRLRPPLWSLPRRIRDRHAIEIAELSEASMHPLRDWLDILRVGLRARLEDCMRSIVTASLALTSVAALLALGYAIAELEHGIREVHRHWWSSAPLAAVALSALGWSALSRRPRGAS
jgi:hypothetical protein